MAPERATAAASAARRPAILPVPDGGHRPFWSVMIPNHDSGDRLARTLASVLDQDPGPEQMQILVVDDASVTQDARAVVAEVAGSRVAVWQQPHNVGAPVNFSTCVQRSVGHWVHILHSDDLVAPDFYGRYRERIEQVAREAGGCAMAVGRSYYVDDDEAIVGTSPEVATDRGVLLDPVGTIARRHPFAFVSVVVARSAYERSGGFDPALAHTNDWEMWTRMAALGPVAVVDEPCSMYRHHAESDTQRLERSTGYYDDTVAAIDVIAERFDDPGEGQAFRREARRRLGARALQVALTAMMHRRWRDAWANAGRVVRMPPSRHSVRAVRRLVQGRMRRVRSGSGTA